MNVNFYKIIIQGIFFFFFTPVMAITICLTGKIQETLPNYKPAFLNAVDFAFSQHASINDVKVATYFYDNKPLSPLRVYHEMIRDNCSAIVGFEYLSDLLLITKSQKNSNVPIFTSYASSNDQDELPANVFMFMPTYDYHAKKMMEYLNNKFSKIDKVLIVTEVDRMDLQKYKLAYKKLFTYEKISYDTLDFIGNDENLEEKLNKFIIGKQFNYVFVLSGAVGSTKIINIMNNHQIVFIGTENFGSSSNQSLFVRLNDKKINAFVVRNLDLLKTNETLKQFSKAYLDKYFVQPYPLSIYTFDALMIILKTIETAGNINTSSILKINYEGISGASIKNGKFHRSDNFIILSIGEKGYIHEK